MLSTELAFMVLCLLSVFGYVTVTFSSKTTISIDGVNFQINGKNTYDGAKNKDVVGLLMNARQINAIFDDRTPETEYLWKYPDTHAWSASRNTAEFVGNLSMYYENGLRSFTVGLQGGNPFGYGHNEPSNISGQPWTNSAYDYETGALVLPYFERLESILKETDALGMAPIVEMFYSAQIGKMKGGDTVIMTAINNTLNWLMNTGYTNFLIEVTNECNGVSNDILGESGMPATIAYIREYTHNRYLIGSSLTGGKIPTDALIAAADMVLLHGNGQSPSSITKMINEVRATDAYKSQPKPILFNEDDHYAFAADANNMKSAIEGHASWGLFCDCNQTTAGDYVYGYQCVPAAWSANTPIKQSFFSALHGYTSG